MSELITTPNLGQPGFKPLHAFSPGDDFYEQLNARLVLLLANHIGDVRVLGQALKAARAGLGGEATEEKVST